MPYRVNDIFYSLQGEGRHTGRAAVFVRFAGCNLRCAFCDTEFTTYREMTAHDMIEAIKPYPARFVVLTGGEPTLQADEKFVDLLHRHGYEVAMESNGTVSAPKNLDWLTVSPKKVNSKWRVTSGERLPDEIKVIFEGDTNPEAVLAYCAKAFSVSAAPETYSADPYPFLLYLQPCDTGDAGRNGAILKSCVAYIEQHPWWRLSLQTHKLIDIK